MEKVKNGKKKTKLNSKNKQKVVVQVGTAPGGNPSRPPGFVDPEAVLQGKGMLTQSGHWTLSLEEARKNPYLAATLDSKTYTSQYPDVYNRPTAIYQQIMEIPIVPGTNAAGLGRFTARIVPIVSGGPVATLIYTTYAPRMPVTVAGGASDVYSSGANAMTAANYISYQSEEGNQITGWTQPTTATTLGNPIAQELRPVAMTVWAAFVADTLTDGGTIAMAPVADCDSRFFSVGPGGLYTGSPLLQLWENVAKLPMSYSGPIRTGAYGYYRPQDNNDVGMARSAGFRQNFSAGNVPDLALGPVLPGIVVSGVSNAPGSVNCLRLEVCTIFEYVTTSRLVPSIPSRVNPEEILLAAKVLEGMPQCVSNENHKRMIMELLARLSPTVSKLLGPLGPIVDAAASAGLSAWDRRLKAKGL